MVRLDRDGRLWYLHLRVYPVASEVWFVGRMIWGSREPTQGGVTGPAFGATYEDRVGTNRAGGARFYPYGEEITSTASDHEKFGTYTRDSYTGLDYADQRYYASSYGRFNTPDPYQALANGANDPGTPQSWNKYMYVLGDPVNQTDRHGLYVDVGGDDDWDTCVEDGVCEDGPYQGGGGGGGGGAVAPSCSISVATSGTPINGQSFTQAYPPPPAGNQLGPYSTVGLYDNLFDQGWYFATQVQGVLSGDTNPADWSAAQTASVGGSVVYLVPGSGTSTVNTSTSGPDNPEQPSILQSVAGAFDWLDDPGLALLSTNGLGTAVRGSMTWNFTSTLTDGSVSCSVNWAVKLTLPYRTGRFGPVRPTPVKPGPKPPLRPVVPRGE